MTKNVAWIGYTTKGIEMFTDWDSCSKWITGKGLYGTSKGYTSLAEAKAIIDGNYHGNNGYWAIKGGSDVYTDWIDCYSVICKDRSVNFKVFEKYEEAEAYAKGEGLKVSTSPTQKPAIETVEEVPKKIYVVRKGYKAGIYNTWEECEPQIDGFIGAEFKTFKDMSEALSWLNKRSNKIEIKVGDIPDTNEDEAVDIYTDGSYNEKTGMCGAGFVAVLDEKPLYEYGCSFEDVYGARNVYGETGAVIKAIQWAKQNSIKRVRINHDYVGVSKWVTGEWKRKKGVSGKYFDKYCKISAGIYISFRWVKGHSGNKWNNVADKLAGDAVK